MSTQPAPEESVERPDRRLLTYYFLSALLIPPLFPVVILPLYFRYHTMRYRFDPEGISMRWGILFRREIVLNYARIQDIQIRANLIERWLGLARIELQTAAGSSGAEMTLEGFTNVEEVRDFLYDRMRGVRSRGASGAGDAGRAPSLSVPGTVPSLGLADTGALAAVLREVAAELRAVREALPRGTPGGGPGRRDEGAGGSHA